MNTFHIKNLGCSKNEVDGNNMQSLLMDAGMLPLSSPEGADLLIVNTCGFIQEAVEESIEVILEYSDYKKDAFFVVGCMVQRYAKELEKDLPEVDLFLGTAQMKYLLKYLHYKGEEKVFTDDLSHQLFPLDRWKQAHLYDESYSYVKIGEGCDNHCTYCIIPKLRGPFTSRKIEDVVKEVKAVAELGIKEVILVSQDTSRYGRDLQVTLVDLLKEVEKVEGIQWIRLHYLYPDAITQELLDYMLKSKKVLPYFDMPIQHVSNKVLKKMNRNITKEEIISLYKRIRSQIPQAKLRTTLIAGFPGETQEDFQELKDFVMEYPFERLGVFAYSDEEEAASYKLPNKVSQEVKERRRDEIMEMQSSISAHFLEKLVGTVQEAILQSREGDYFVARLKGDSPDVDGVCMVPVKEGYDIGEIVLLEITGSDEYDVEGVFYESCK